MKVIALTTPRAYEQHLTESDRIGIPLLNHFFSGLGRVAAITWRIYRVCLWE